jgi:hypothetical protein
MFELATDIIDDNVNVNGKQMQYFFEFEFSAA